MGQFILARMWRKGNPPLLLVIVKICATTVEINMAVPLQVENLSSSKTSHTILGHIAKGCFIVPQNTCSTMFIVVLFIIAETRNSLDALNRRTNKKSDTFAQ